MSTDWAAIATHIDQRRAIYVQHGEDYATATAKAFRDELHGMAEAAEQVDAEIRHQEMWRNRAMQAEHGWSRLQAAVDLTEVARIRGVMASVNAAHHQRNAPHNEDCWQKHAGCLADRIRRQLEGQAV